MQNKLFLAAAGLTALTFAAPFAPARAATDYDRRSDDPMTTRNTGFYAGGFGGYSWTDVDANTVEADVNGGDFGLFAGYHLDTFLDRTLGIGLGAALEVHYAWSNADDTTAFGDVEKGDEWGVSFRPGLSFLNYEEVGLRPYAILGYRNAEFDTSVPGASDEENLDGFELGIGTELIAFGDYGVRLDYAHVFYGDEGNIEADEDDLRLGLAYHF